MATPVKFTLNKPFL